MTWMSWLTVAIASVTIAGVAIGRWPWLRADRVTIAVVDAAALLICGALSLEQAYKALDLDTLLLLLSSAVQPDQQCSSRAGFAESHSGAGAT